jgi:hypothetical protein
MCINRELISRLCQGFAQICHCKLTETALVLQTLSLPDVKETK